MPTRLLIGPGFLLIGAGLLLMRGLEPSSDWTHLLPGLIVAGVGAGLLNVPLASTAVGVVEPARAGMASGINSTFRQVGIATGIAALGALFVAQVRDGVESALTGSPLGGAAQGIAEQVSAGQASQAIASAPPPLRDTVTEAARAGFVGGLNDLLLVGALIAFAAAVAALALIRQRDFVVDPVAAPAAADARAQEPSLA